MTPKTLLGLGLFLSAILSQLAFAIESSLPVSKKPINVENILRHVRDGRTISGFRIQGRDIIEALRQAPPGTKLEISDSLILGSIEFASLPKLAINELLTDGNKRLFEQSRKHSPNPAEVAKASVHHSIFISNSKILSEREAAKRDSPETKISDLAGLSNMAINGASTYYTGSLTFEDVDVFGDINLERAVLAKQTIFENCSIAGEFRFDQAVFFPLGPKLFDPNPEINIFRLFSNLLDEGFKPVEKQTHIFVDITCSYKAKYSQAIFIGDVYFGGGNFSNVEFNDSRFERFAFFEDTTFETSNFEGIQFAGPVLITGKFENGTIFKGTKFAHTVVFAGKFKKQLDFTNSDFGGSACFFGDFNSLIFTAARFETDFFLGDIGSDPAIITEDINFLFAIGEGKFYIKAKISGDLTFDETHIKAQIYLTESVVNGRLSFNNSRLEDGADFRDSTINKLQIESVRRRSVFDGRFDFGSTEISDIQIQNVTFTGTVDFSNARLGGESGAENNANAGVEISNTTFWDDVFFERTLFQGPVVLKRVRIKGLADFTGAKFEPHSGRTPSSFALWFTSFQDPKLRWEQLPAVYTWERQSEDEEQRAESRSQTLSTVLWQLEGQFREQGLLNDANAARFNAKLVALEERRNAVFEKGHLNTGSPLFLEWLVSEAEWWVWGGLSGYGTKLWWVIGWAAGLALLFNIFYAGSKNLLADTDNADAGRIRQRMFDLPQDYFASYPYLVGLSSPLGVRRVWYALGLSVAVMLKVGPRNAMIEGPLRQLLRLQWALGYYLVAALIYTLSETWPLLNRLLSGVL